MLEIQLEAKNELRLILKSRSRLYNCDTKSKLYDYGITIAIFLRYESYQTCNLFDILVKKPLI